MWRVRWWQYPDQLAVDDTSLRDALLSAARPWEVSNHDRGTRDAPPGLRREGARRRQEERSAGRPVPGAVALQALPPCGHVERTCVQMRCSGVGQLSFVSYCGGCGSLEAPYLPTCNTHHQVKIEFPASASAREIRFMCPVCNITLRTGFGFGKCRTCGEQVSHDVHRASSVYTARSFVMVNSAQALQRVQRLRAAGWRASVRCRSDDQGMESADSVGVDGKPR